MAIQMEVIYEPMPAQMPNRPWYVIYPGTPVQVSEGGNRWEPYETEEHYSFVAALMDSADFLVFAYLGTRIRVARYDCFGLIKCKWSLRPGQEKALLADIRIERNTPLDGFAVGRQKVPRSSDGQRAVDEAVPRKKRCRRDERKSFR